MLSESSAETQKQVYTFAFIEPVLSRQPHHAFVSRGSRHGAGGSQSGSSHVSIVIERPITTDGHRFEVFGHEDDHGDSSTRIDAEGVHDFRTGVPVEESKFNGWCGLGEHLEDRSLSNTVATPDA